MRPTHVFLLFVPLVACGFIKKKQSVLDREDAEAQAANAEAQAVDAAAQKILADTADAARLNDAARLAYVIKAAKACGVKPDAYIPATVRELTKMCIVLVDAGLKVPGSGNYPDLPSETETKGMNTTDGCRMFIDSYVDAKNTLGVTTRTRYRCSYDPTIGVPSYKVLQ